MARAPQSEVFGSRPAVVGAFPIRAVKRLEGRVSPSRREPVPDIERVPQGKIPERAQMAGSRLICIGMATNRSRRSRNTAKARAARCEPNSCPAREAF